MRRLDNNYKSFKESIVDCISKIPFTEKMYVPQGICFVDGYYFLTMYDSSRIRNSIICMFYDNKFIKKVYLDNKAHCGGISYDYETDSIFISDSGYKNHSYVKKIAVDDLITAENNSIVNIIARFEVDKDNSLYSSSAKHSSVSYLNCFSGCLFVGNYTSHIDSGKAIIKIYKILDNGNLSKSYEIIKNPFCNVQGLCVFKYKSKILYLFSRSFGRKRNSLIHICEFYKGDFYIVSTMVLPSMLEQVSVSGNNLVLIFESCAKIFRKTALTVNDGIYLLDLEKVVNTFDNYSDFCKCTSFFVSNSKYKF